MVLAILCRKDIQKGDTDLTISHIDVRASDKYHLRSSLSPSGEALYGARSKVPPARSPLTPTPSCLSNPTV